MLSTGLWRRSKPIVDETFMSIPGPPHIEPPRVPGPDLDVAAQRQQLLTQRPEDAACALGLLDREVGPRDIADEQRVAGQDRPRLLAAPQVEQRERRVLGPVAGRVERSHDERAELPRVAVVERLVVVIGLRQTVDVDGGAGRGR
jgi:hypothetical protein